MLIAIGTGFVATVGSPRRSAVAGGLVISAGVLANVTAVLNQPGLLEVLQFEQVERQQMAALLQHTSAGDSVTTLSNGRVTGPLADAAGGRSLLQGWAHLLHGKWLVLIGLLMYLFTASGRLPLRLIAAAPWILVGAGLSCGLCWPRLVAEYCWCRSEQHAAAADYERAREAFTYALDICPPLQDLERAWYWAGKLDFLEGRASSFATFFQAAQLANDWQHLEAAMLMDHLIVSSEEAPPPARRQCARVLVQLGLAHYVGGPVYDLRQTLDSRVRLRSTASAVAMWTRALSIQPERKDCLLYRALALAESTDSADQVERDALHFVAATADRSLHADVLSTLGDVYFEAGQVQRAREYYEQSKRIFELPKDINFRARRGLLGV